MSIIKCHECLKEVSSEAKACPHCGAKVRKPMSRTAKLIIAAVVLVAIGQQITKTDELKEPSKTPAQIAMEEAAEKSDRARIRAARSTAETVKAQAKNPDSVKFVQIAVSDDAALVCVSYRATNSFNAIVPGVMVMTNNTVSPDESKWKKLCAKASGLHDYTYAG